MEKQVLSIEQMQELRKLGIDISKASMCWIGCADGNDVYPYNSAFKDIFETHKETMPSVLTPAFTLQDMLNLLTFDNRLVVIRNKPDEWLDSAFNLLKTQYKNS